MDKKLREEIKNADARPGFVAAVDHKHCDAMRSAYFQALQVADDYKKNGEHMLERQARKQAEELHEKWAAACEGKPV